jgi:uncharacterized protein (DUF2141 family)
VPVVAALLFLVATVAVAQPEDAPQFEQGLLTLHVVGFKNDTGRAMIALVNRREHFLSREHEPFRHAAVAIRDKQARWDFDNLPPGEYAISVFHDENNNGELDSNFLRIPTEDYGFSNEARATFGPPDYDAARFELNQARQEVTITVK